MHKFSLTDSTVFACVCVSSHLRTRSTDSIYGVRLPGALAVGVMGIIKFYQELWVPSICLLLILIYYSSVMDVSCTSFHFSSMAAIVVFPSLKSLAGSVAATAYG